MTQDDLPAFARAIHGLAEMHGREPSDKLVELYWAKLNHWTRGEFLAAADHLLGAQFMPKPFDFELLRRAKRSTAGEAWAQALQHCRGAYRDGSGVDEGGPIDRAIEQLGGYRRIAMTDLQFLPERRFAELYAEQVDIDDARAALPELSADPGAPALEDRHR